MKHVSRVFHGDVVSADERCAICGDLLDPNFNKLPAYWLEFPIVEPMLVDDVKVCDRNIKPECLNTWLEQHKVIPVGIVAVRKAQMVLF